jgi:signal transduction histidine kinase
VYDLSPRSSDNESPHPRRPRARATEGADSAAQLRDLAELGVRLVADAACLIRWETPQDSAVLRTASNAILNARLDSLLAGILRDPRYRSLSPCRSGHSKRYDGAARECSLMRFDDRELAAACGRHAHDRSHVATAVAIANGHESAATVIMIAPAASDARDLPAAAELIARAAIAILRAGAASTSRDFWRDRTAESGQRLASLKSGMSGDAAERDRLDCTMAAAEKLRPRNRLAGLGALVAKLGPFDAWIIATLKEGALRVSASANTVGAPPVIDVLNPHFSALAGCFQRQSKILRSTLPAKRTVYAEDAIFAHYGGYLCVPFANGAIALASSASIGAAMIARVEAVMARLNPLLERWDRQAENDRLHGLVRSLGLRMFTAVDAERARIARDLHDHQAQLLAAARIGIAAGPDQARGIFMQLEEDLRARVRELKPPNLGRSTLAEGLRQELRRLAEAGLKTRLIHADRMNALTRPVQQLCYQVTREALANVVRHANASRVEIAIEKRGATVRLSILDDGTGIDTASGKGGIGLDGLRERLEFMGGRLLIVSKAGSTRLVAEIPEPS